MANSNRNKKKKTFKKNQAILTTFILIFPVLLLAMLGMNIPNWAMQICLFFYEAILIKNFIDDHYKQD